MLLQMPYKKYELHCTLGQASAETISAFKKSCNEKDIKVIEFSNGPNKSSVHVMTVNNDYSIDEVINRASHISLLADLCDSKIIRTKVEVAPLSAEEFVEGEQYFETHQPIRLGTTALASLSLPKGWSISCNLAKAPNERGESATLTFRQKNISLRIFRDKIQTDLKILKSYLEKENQLIIVEKCIFDDNQDLDNDWISY